MMPDAPELTILLRQPPLGNGFAREALDIALAGSAFVERLSVVFVHAGVLQLRPGLDGTAIGLAPFSANLTALPEYGINALYAHAPSLQRFGISADALSLPCRLIDDAALRRLTRDSDKVLAL